MIVFVTVSRSCKSRHFLFDILTLAELASNLAQIVFQRAKFIEAFVTIAADKFVDWHKAPPDLEIQLSARQ